MPGKISNFVAEVSKNGLATANRFGVDIFPPPGLQITGSAEKASLLCDEASMPGLLIQTRANRIYGAPHQQAVGFSYTGESIPFTFMLDRYLEVKQFIESWMFGIFDPNTNNMAYQEKYVSTIYLHQLDKADNIVFSCILLDAFPISMQMLPVGNAQTNTHRLNVSFAFRKWVPYYSPENSEYKPEVAPYNPSWFGFRKPGFLEPEQLMKMGQVVLMGKTKLPPFFPNFR
jgi:hypothetical protein